MEFRFHTDTITTLIEVNPSSSFPQYEKSSQKFHPSRLTVSRNALISTLIISEFPHENVSLEKKKKKKREKDIFIERRIFNIFHPLDIDAWRVAAIYPPIFLHDQILCKSIEEYR